MRVLLVHGLARTRWSMRRLAKALERDGHVTSCFGYSARSESIQEVEERLRLAIEALQGAEPYALVGHSLGGLLLRKIVAEGPSLHPRMLILLASPNQAPRLAPRASKWWPFRWWTGDARSALSDFARFGALPPLRCEVRVVAGTRGWSGTLDPFGGEPNDGVVALTEAALPGHGVDLTVRASHTFIMNNRRVVDYVRQELAHGAGN